jgi:hypothetical protein
MGLFQPFSSLKWSLRSVECSSQSLESFRPRKDHHSLRCLSDMNTVTRVRKLVPVFHGTTSSSEYLKVEQLSPSTVSSREQIKCR